MQLDPGIFKAYDVRGLYGEQIDEDAAYAIGRGFARVLSDLGGKPVDQLRVGVGHDMRLTAPALTQAYVRGITDEGAAVLDAGQVGTEMLYYLVGSRGLDGGLMCTASHNPKEYTGAKLVREGAIALSGDQGIQDIRRLLESGLSSPSGETGSMEDVDVYDEFHEAALKFIDPANVKPLKVVVDGGNGMAGPMVGPLLDRLPLDLVRLRWEPDGNMPDGEPNPLLEHNRKLIIDTVRETGADLGIAWDGDADRCFFIDDAGDFVDGDFLTAILAEHLLAKQPGAAILYDVRASRAVPDSVSAAGGSAHRNRVGHAFFKTRMRDEGAIFGGEVSGHYYFRDFYNADSGTVPALLVLEKLSVEGARLSELVGRYRSRYFISGEINSTVADGAAKMREIEERYSDASFDHLDGVSVDYDDWHFNVRPSNTEPLLRLNLESLVSVEDMERRRDEVLALIKVLTRWYHTVDLPDGTATPGWFDLRDQVGHYGLPDALAGKRCLDVGTWDGFWAFEMEKRGAAEVVALDLDDEAQLDWPPRRRPASFASGRGDGFRELHERLGSKVERVELSVYDATPERLGSFDVVFCGSVLIHLRDQLLALERIASVCRGVFVSAEEYDRLTSVLPVALNRWRGDDPSAVVFWRPNLRAWRRMLWSAGFERVERVGRFTLKATDGVKVPHVVHHASK